MQQRDYLENRYQKFSKDKKTFKLSCIYHFKMTIATTLRPKDTLEIIQLGYDPDRADFLDGLRRKVYDVIPIDVFNKPGNFAVIHSYGAWVNIDQYRSNQPESRTQLTLPATMIIRAFEEDSNIIFAIETLNNDKGRPGYHLRANGIEMIGKDIPGITGYELEVPGKKIRVYPHQEATWSDITDTLGVPSLPKNQRNSKFWEELSKMYGFKIEEPQKGENKTITYRASGEEGLKLKFSSSRLYEGLTLSAKLVEPIDGESLGNLEGVNSLFSECTLYLNGNYPKAGAKGTNIEVRTTRRESFRIAEILEKIVKRETQSA